MDNNNQENIYCDNKISESTEYNFYQVPYGETVQEPDTKKKKKKKKPVTMKKVVAIGFSFMIITVLVNSAILYAVLSSSKFESGKNNSGYAIGTTLGTGANGTNDNVINTVNTQSTTGYSVADIAEMVMPSVVSITSISIYEQNYNPFYGTGGQYQVQGAGSGIIIGQTEDELLIVTNNHVVEDTVGLSIRFCDNTEVDTATVKGTNSSNDIAIVGVKLSDLDSETLSQIKIATLGDSDELRVGDGVIAIGNALGYGQSVTVGYVSAKDRQITIDGNTMTVIQTDAAINGGNSGGALINMKGEVIGINVAKSSSSSSYETSVEGMGYAIPLSKAKNIIEKLISDNDREKYSEQDRGYLGVTVITVDTDTSSVYNIPKGAYIRGIEEGSPIKDTELIAGSVIIAVNGYEIASADELVEELSYYKPGDRITITAYVPMDGVYVEKEFEITLGAKTMYNE